MTMRTAANRYGVYLIPEEFAGREVSKLLFQSKVNEPRTIELIRQLCQDGDVISGGAFVGDFMPALARGLAPKAQLHTFEPNPLSFEAASATIAANRLQNVNIHPCAVGEAAATLNLRVTSPKGQPLGGMSTIVDEEDSGTTPVDVKPLDSLVDGRRKVSVIHLDVEGFEMHALRGAKRIIDKHRPALILEANNEPVRTRYAAEINDAFPEAGYRMFGVMERNAIFVAV